MATQRCNLSVARIDLNALDLQRREAALILFSGSIYNKKMNPANTCGMAIKGPHCWACSKSRCWQNKLHVHVHNCTWSLFFLTTGFIHLYSVTDKLAYKETFAIVFLFMQKRDSVKQGDWKCLWRDSWVRTRGWLHYTYCILLNVTSFITEKGPFPVPRQKIKSSCN